MHFRLATASGEVVDEGDGTVEVVDGAVIVSPQLGQPLRVTPAQISGVSEPQPFVVRIDLSDGSGVELSQLGAIRTQLLTQIGDVRVEESHHGLVTIGIGVPQRFQGSVDDVQAEITLYDDGLVAIPTSGLPVQAPYALIESVSTDPSGYRITIDEGEGGTLVVQRLARMTSQFLELLRKRVSDARGRTGAFLATLLPGLGPIPQRSVAGLLRDGVAVPKHALDAIDTTIWPTLMQSAALPHRMECAEHIATLGEVALGFHQRSSVEVQASGTTHWAEAKPVQSSGPGMGQSQGMSMLQRGMGMALAQETLGMPGPGFGATPAGGMEGGGFAAPFGVYGGMLAMRMLRGDSSWAGGQRPTTRTAPSPQSPSAPGKSSPAHTDFDALVVSGDEPTILAFQMARTRGGDIIYETLNQTDHATYVFHDPGLSLRAFNRALILLGYHIEVLAGDLTGAGARYAEAIKQLPHLRQLAAAFRGRAIHLADWEAQLQQLLG